MAPRDTSSWQQVGIVGVDAGLIWLGDPCYCVTPDAPSHPAKSWPEFCAMMTDDDFQSKQWNYPSGHPGLGVTVQSGYGDGVYPVYIRRNREGVIAEVRVVFDEEEEGEE